MKTPTLAGSMRYASGEELLLLAVFQPQVKRQVDHELDRRALLRRAAAPLRLPRGQYLKRAA